MTFPCTLALVEPGLASRPAELGTRFRHLLLCAADPGPLLGLGLELVVPRGPAPLSSVLVALTTARTDHVVVARLVDRALLEPLAVAADGADALLARRDELLPGRYRRSCARALERALSHGRLTAGEALRGLRVAELSGG